MTLAEQLLFHATEILPSVESNLLEDEVRIRRAVSACYYALFHFLNEEAVSIIAPNVSRETNHRVQRWFEHSTTKQICGRFLKAKLDQPLLGLIGEQASEDLQLVCSNFIALQEARHFADYDLSYSLNVTEARKYLFLAFGAISAWKRIKDTSEANIFVLSLLMWKNWEKDR